MTKGKRTKPTGARRNRQVKADPTRITGEHTIPRGVQAEAAAVVAGGEVRCYDMLKVRGGANSIAEGAATTTQMTDAIISKLG